MRTYDMWTLDFDREEQILEAAERILRKRLERKGRIGEPTDATNYLRAHCAHLDHEIFGAIYLDSRHQILAIVDHFTGTIDGAEVHPREIVKAALAQGAAAVIFFHNHPSGNTEPSAADRAVTARLKQALALVDVRVLDHFVIAGTDYTSMAARGWV